MSKHFLVIWAPETVNPITNLKIVDAFSCETLSQARRWTNERIDKGEYYKHGLGFIRVVEMDHQYFQNKHMAPPNLMTGAKVIVHNK